MMPDWTVIYGRKLIDGAGNPPIDNPAVLIEGSRIVSAGPERDVQLPRTESIATLDYSDKTLLPGLIDCHVHLCFSADDDPVATLCGDCDDMLLLRAARNAQIALKAGVTTLRDCGGRNKVTFSVREAITKGIIQGPRLLLAGRPVTVTGGHCFFFNGEADGVDGVRRCVRQLFKEGADFVKLMASGGGMTPNTRTYLPYYSVEELTVAVSEAHRVGRKAAAHCHATKSMEDCITAGIDTIEHASFEAADGQCTFEPTIAEKIVSRGIYVCPTLGYCGPGSPVYPVDRGAGCKARFEAAMSGSNFSRMHQMGVKLIAGTDAGCNLTTFDSYPLCLELAVAGGMTNMQAIQSGTGLAAEALGIADATGTIQPGRQADIIAVDGDPLEDIGALWNVVAVMKAGVPCRT